MSRLDRELAKLDAITGAVGVEFDSKSLKSDGTTLLLRGILATTGIDRVNEAFDGPTLRAAFKRYFERNPVVVDEHKLSRVVGRLTNYKFTNDGIEVEAEVPKPPPGELMATYERLRDGVLRAFSIGGRWKRMPVGGGVEKLFPQEILEASVAGLGVNGDCVMELVGTKSMGNMDGELAHLEKLTAGAGPLDDALERLRGL